ncbi:GNAT family N-acetyltransferase [Geitlerinema calcuttense]|uniref:GNAT family N-acetyltransferase n=1 Tax=Geitlerinema calcuttense NRMC-F 0142 TaxID=2922238 RepID=A0ABT7LXA5_9CYAN|nr:GNAT family N-acetyltransferase [Geitlerinema calcuttense]MCD8487622.1 GNAT family N-acetyltransferase [Desertifilum sp.]MDL5056646.1 GNAT family N-acetyltransferase [Geitlerinema calcuttense NRMC-F 0142]
MDAIFSEVSPVTLQDDPAMLDEAIAIYLEAFPPNERHPESLIRDRVLSGRERLIVGELESQVAFMALIWPLSGQPFGLLDYAAARQDCRGLGLGTAFMDFLRQYCQQRGEYLLLEVEDPKLAVDERDRHVRLRRIEFYRRSGGSLLENVPYILPPLQESTPTPMVLMLFPSDRAQPPSAGLVRELIQQIYWELCQRDPCDPYLNSFLDQIVDPIVQT